MRFFLDVRGSLAVGLVPSGSALLPSRRRLRSAMIELALQTKRKEDQRGNTPGLSMFEPAPNWGQIIFPGRCSSAFLVASTVERAEYRGPQRHNRPTRAERFPRAGATCE